MSAGREVWVKIRASEAEWHAKARSVGLSLSDLVRRSTGRVRTWTGSRIWSPSSDVQIGRVVDEFEKTAWAGLDRELFGLSPKGDTR